MTKAKQSARDEAIATLRETLKPGMTVYTVLRSVSRSGMSRNIDLFVIEDKAPCNITWLAAKATGYSTDASGALKMGGCGMDMGFHAVYELSRVLYPDGFNCIGSGCPANDHSNEPRHQHVASWTHSDGGYAIGQRWM